MDIGRKIKTLRTAKALTQEKLAQELGVTPQAVSRWENGSAMPDIALLPALSVCFGVRIDDFFELSDDAQFDRIDNMVEKEDFLSRADFDYAERFLKDRIAADPNDARALRELAHLYHHRAESYNRKGEVLVKRALELEPTVKEGHSILSFVANGSCWDWCSCNHRELIDYYYDFVEKNPDYRSGYLWLLPQLLADHRLEEAETCVETIERLDKGYRARFNRGMLEIEKGNVSAALTLFAEIEAEFPEEWIMYLSLGDAMVRIGDYERAKGYYRKYQDNQKERPKYTDGLTSIAQLCEIRGDYAGAIAAAEEEIAALASDWDTTAGETVDQHLRRIERLKKKL